MKFNFFLKIKVLQTFLTYKTMVGAVKKTISGKLACEKTELDLAVTLKGGQSFRWKETSEKKFRGVFDSTIWTLSQDSKNLIYTAHNANIKSHAEARKKLQRYFNLNVSLEKNLQEWSKCDENFKNFTEKVAGVRILDQDVVENVFSFICSANNHISRITSMIEKLCLNFGEKIGEIDEQVYYDFPSIDSLAQEGVDGILVKEGFGYRAKYIHQSAKKLIELDGRSWLDQLKKKNGGIYEDVRVKLRVLPGVGHKVADCICLMSLGHLESIPVDTHILQVAKEFYMPNLKDRCKGNSASIPICYEINENFRNLWGEKAGWAQAVVFCARISRDDKTKKVSRKTKKKDNTEQELQENKKVKKK